MPALIEIPELERVVLSDASAHHLYDFLYSIYAERDYANLDKSLLLKARDSATEFLGFLRQDNVLTVGEGYKDFKEVSRIIGHKTGSLNKRLNENARKHDAKSENKKLLLEDISDAIFEILRLSKIKVFKPEDVSLYSSIGCYVSGMQELKESSLKNRQLYMAALYYLCKDSSVALVVSGIGFRGRLIELLNGFLTEKPEIFASIQPRIRFYVHIADVNSNNYNTLEYKPK